MGMEGETWGLASTFGSLDAKMGNSSNWGKGGTYKVLMKRAM